ncbi:alpha/beta fold hydrolase [Brachybacterium hainanense]|uniref:Alpha/beta fold hydrolase n=1 Tax=Brachybacterium hainanense TaxID=1541174 RepID=A0ABV6RC43_9MICO
MGAVRIHRLGDPVGRPVLLLHGGGVAGWMWDPMIEHLGPGFRLIVPDLPGHDGSADDEYASHDEAVDALVAVLEAEAAGPAPVVGFSLGAQLAVLLAARRPDLVDRVAVISAQAVPSRWPAATLGLLHAAAPLMESERFARVQARQLFVPEHLIQDCVRTSQRLSTRTLLASVGENIRFVVPDRWSVFPGEALVLVGGSERSTMRRSAQLLAEPHDDEPEVLSGCGHGIPLQEPVWLAQRLRPWLEKAR